MAPDLPARIDRATLERIIQRATELQTGERDVGDALTEEQVLALGREVGIPAQYLRQALLEEQVRATPAVAGWLDTLVGPGQVHAERVVVGTTDVIEEQLLDWMDRHEILTVQRHQTGRITWEPLRGIQSAIRRSAAMFGGNRPAMLSRAGTVGATITPLESGYCHVHLTAELRATRGAVIGGAAAVLSLGLAGTLVLAALNAFWLTLLGPLPLSFAAAYGVTRPYMAVAERSRLGLERVLDHLERGRTKPANELPPRSRVLDSIVQEVRKALKP